MKTALSKIGAIGFASLLTASLATTTAASAGTSAAKPGDKGAVAMKAPQTQGGAPAQARKKPTTSPSVKRVWLPNGKTYKCKSGYACSLVPYNKKGGYIFVFYKYGKYSLSNWLGAGQVHNHQTGGASMRMYSKAGKQLRCYAPSKKVQKRNWNSTWSIRLSSKKC